MLQLSGIPLVRYFGILSHVLGPEFGETGLICDQCIYTGYSKNCAQIVPFLWMVLVLQAMFHQSLSGFLHK